ncbi:MAG: hypothetical protein ABFC84_11040 [Veillonellales bacterium]
MIVVVEILQYSNIIIVGFLVWLVIAPRISSPRYGELFLAYMTALLFSLIASSEIIMVKPVAFFFTIGGVLAFCYTLARMTLRVTLRK